MLKLQQLTSLQDIVINKDNVKVVMKEEYKNYIFDNETVKKLQKSEEDIENGKTRKAVDVVKELRLKYGF